MDLAEALGTIYGSEDRVAFLFKLNEERFVAVVCQIVIGQEETAVFLCDRNGSNIDYSEALAVVGAVDVEKALNLLNYTKNLDK